MIRTFTGPMHSGKTAAMIVEYNKIYNKEHVKCFKPAVDTRDYGILKSKDFDIEIPAIVINSFDDILKYVDKGVRSIFIDEVQMLEGNYNILSYLSICLDIDVYVAGLNMTSEQESFGVMPYILAISDEVNIIRASCFDCGREAQYTYYIGQKDDEVLVGDKGYLPLCPRCLLKRRGKVNTKKMLLRKTK